jgi:preprotein translocase subunit YajC
MLQNLLLLLLLQDGATAPQEAPSGGLLGTQLVPLVLIFVLFFFLLILPERKKQKHRQKMLDALKKGDRVVTSGGLHGTVVSATSDLVVLQAAENVRLRFSRTAIQGVVAEEKPVSEAVEASKA